MSVQTQIDRLAAAKAAIKTAIEGKGVTVPDATKLDGLAALIESIEAGGGGGDLFHATITPVTSGEVITVELADTPCEVKAVIVSAGKTVGSGAQYYPIASLGWVSDTPTVNTISNALNIAVSFVYFKSGNSWSNGAINNSLYYNSVPNGTALYRCATFWHGTTREINPNAKFFVTDGTDQKYGLCVGSTYEVWAIF